MSNERLPLPAALGQIVDGAAAAHAARDLAGAGLPLAQMHAAARRRRVTFGAGVAVGAAAVVGVLVLGAAAAGGLIDRDPTPPVQTPDSAAWDVDYSPCAQAPPAYEGQAGPFALLHRTVETDSRAMLTIETATIAMQEGSTTTLERVGTQHEVYALRGVDFTVVGVLGTPREGAPDEMVPLTDATTFMTTTAPLFSCTAQDGTTRLEPGDYRLDVSRRVEVATDGVRQEVRIRTGPYLTIPEGPETGDVEALPAVALSGEVPGCGERFGGAPDGDPVLHVGLGPTEGFGDLVPPGEPFDDVTGPVHPTAMLINDVPDAGTVRVAEGGVHLLLTSERIVVGHAAPVMYSGSAAATLEPGASRAADDLNLTPDCGVPMASDTSLALGSYELWVVIPTEGAEGSILVAGPWPLTVTGTPWQLVDVAEVPADVPVLGEVIAAEVHRDGDSWRVHADLSGFARDAYTSARDALVAAGFTLDGEQTDPGRPMWSYGAFSSPEYYVELDVSNETGGGFIALYLIHRQPPSSEG